ncbi:MAG: DUF1853 family protein [Halioglobus sp.]
MQTCALALTEERALWLQQLDSQPNALLHHLEERANRRLGLYFEALWHFFLTQDAQTDLIAHNLPVHSAGQTAGEFDILYYCHQRQRHCHLELAVKYFLGTSLPALEGESTTLWLGPNSRDRLDLKLQHMLTRQIQLSDDEAAREVLRDLGIVELEREIALRGYLFAPTMQDATLPPGYLPGTQRSHWLPVEQLADYLPSLRADTYLILPRLRWLSPVIAAQGEPLLPADELRAAVAEHMAQRSVPVLVAALDAGGSELARFFVTPAQWPEPGALPR